MKEEENEIIFNSSEEAFQKLADLTGKKVMIPNQEGPVVENEEESVVSSEAGDDLRKRGKAYENAADLVDKEIESLNK